MASLPHTGQHAYWADLFHEIGLTSTFHTLNRNIDVSICSRALVAYSFLTTTPSVYFAARNDDIKLHNIMGDHTIDDTVTGTYDMLFMMLISHLAAAGITLMLLVNSVHVWAPQISRGRTQNR